MCVSFQTLDASLNRGARQTEPAVQLRDANAGISLQKRQNFAFGFIDLHDVFSEIAEIGLGSVKANGETDDFLATARGKEERFDAVSPAPLADPLHHLRRKLPDLTVLDFSPEILVNTATRFLNGSSGLTTYPD